MKRIYFILAIVLLLTGCSKEPWKWDNHTIHMFPDDPEHLYIKHGNGTFYKAANNDEFHVELKTYEVNEQPMFKLKVTTTSQDFHHIYFDGFDNTFRNGEINYSKAPHIEWKDLNRSVIVEGKLIPIEEMPYEFYEIFLSRDKQKK